MRRARSTEKAFVYAIMLGVLLIGASTDGTRDTGTVPQWLIFWAICLWLAGAILHNLNTPTGQYRAPNRHTRRHHRRVTRRDYKEHRRGH